MNKELIPGMGGEMTAAIISRFDESTLMEHVKCIFSVMDLDANLRTNQRAQCYVCSALSTLDCPPDQKAYADAYRNLMLICASVISYGTLSKDGIWQALGAAKNETGLNLTKAELFMAKMSNPIPTIRDFTTGQLLCSNIDFMAHHFRGERCLSTIADQYGCVGILADKLFAEGSFKGFADFYNIPDKLLAEAKIVFSAIQQSADRDKIQIGVKRNMPAIIEVMYAVKRYCTDEQMADQLLSSFAERIADGSMVFNLKSFGNKSLVDIAMKIRDPYVYLDAMETADPVEYLESSYIDEMFDMQKASLEESIRLDYIEDILHLADNAIRYAYDREERLTPGSYPRQSAIGQIKDIYAILMHGCSNRLESLSDEAREYLDDITDIVSIFGII